MSEPQETKKSSPLAAVLILLAGLAFIAGGYVYAKKAHEPVTVTASNLNQTPGVVKQEPAPAGQSALEAAAQKTEEDAARSHVTKTEYKPVMEAEGRFLGKKDAPVKMIEFASLTCTHCAHFHNDVLNEFRVKYVDTGLVQIEFREFPLNKPALDASKLLNCLPEKQYFAFSSMLFQTQDHWAFAQDYMTPLRQNAKLAGLSDFKIDACLADKDAERKLIEDINANLQKYKLESTPTFILNDGVAKISGSVPVSEMAKTIDPLLPVDLRPSQTTAPAEPATSSPETAPAQ